MSAEIPHNRSQGDQEKVSTEEKGVHNQEQETEIQFEKRYKEAKLTFVGSAILINCSSNIPPVNCSIEEPV